MTILSSAQREAITDEFNEFVEQITIIGWREQRSWSEFCSKFSIPDYKSLEQRMTANFLHYRTNYLIITVSIFILRILLAPLLFLSIVCCAAASAAFILLYKQPILIGDFEVDHKMKITGCVIVSVVFLALCGAVEHLLWGVIFSAIVVVGHMVLRPRSISSKSNKVYEEMKIGTSGWGGLFGSSKKEKSNNYDHQQQQSQQSMEDPENPGGAGGSKGEGYDTSRHDTAAGGGSVRKRVSPQGLY